MALLPDKQLKFMLNKDIDYTSLEKRMIDIRDEMQRKLNIKEGSQKVFFDLESNGLEKYKKPMMTMRSFNTNAVTIADSKHLRPVLDKEEIRALMKTLQDRLKDIQPAIAPISFIGSGMSHMLRDHAKFFPIMPPPGMKLLVIDSCSELNHAIEALIRLGQVGINASKAGRDLRDIMLKMEKETKLKNKNKNEFINDGKDVSYSRQQSRKWANSYSHKRPKKL